MSIAFFTRLVKKPLVWLYVGGVVLLVVGAWLWLARVQTNPQRAFWETIGQGMALSGVTLEAEQLNGSTNVRQVTQFSLGAASRTHTLTTLSQEGTVVKNETIGTPSADYTRYQYIKTNQKKADGKPMNFSSLIGLWAKSLPGTAQLFEQTALGTSLPLGGMTIPIANLPHAEREALLQQIQADNVYKPSFDKVHKTHAGGRLLYTYDVSIQPVAYAALMKRLTKDMGLHVLDQLDPNAYKGQESLKLQFTIDVRARRVVQAAAPDSAFKQSFTSYDVPVRVELPAHTISTAELQKRLASLQ